MTRTEEAENEVLTRAYRLAAVVVAGDARDVDEAALRKDLLDAARTYARIFAEERARAADRELVAPVKP